MQTIVGLVSAGIGIAVVPACIENLRRPGVVYRQIRPRTPSVDTVLMWTAGNRSEVLRSVVDVCREIGVQRVSPTRNLI